MKREKQKDQAREVNGVAPESKALLVRKRIAMRAYDLYLQRGGIEGHAEEDWLQAEREVLQEERY